MCAFFSPDPPSSPRNLRYSVVGAMDVDREYRVFWSASSVTGGLPVNYSVKLCLNDSYVPNNGVCNWSSNPDCRPRNILTKDKDFFCVLQYSGDFVSSCEKTCNYTLSVVAENAVGSATSWRYLPFIPVFSGNVSCVGICCYWGVLYILPSEIYTGNYNKVLKVNYHSMILQLIFLD